MNNSINFKNLNNILLYKKAFDKFININKIKINNISDIDYLIPILFLTEMNRYCKNNKISIHGYYIAQALLMLYMNLKNHMLFNKEINYIIIINFYKNISLNIEYLNTRIDDSNIIKKKINYNYHNLIIEISNLIEEILISENKNTFIDFLSKFFYILLILAKFVGTGEIIKVPNLIKLGEYYGNLFTCCILLENNISNYNLQDLFEKYINYKSILIESIYNNNYYSDTIDEIIKYIDIYITKNLK